MIAPATPTAVLTPDAHGATWGPFIDGVWRASPDVDRFEVINPATGRPLASVAVGSSAGIDAAVASASRGFARGWGDRSLGDRAALLHEVAAHIRDHVDEIAEMTTLETGKPLREAYAIDARAAHFEFDFFAELATATLGCQILDQGSSEAQIIREPYGVVAAIIPFNWPSGHVASKCAPALVAGNTVVLKPSQQAPLAALRLVELVNDVLPPGVLNAVPGVHAGAVLAAHPGVSRVAFTDSMATGRKFMAPAANPPALPATEPGGPNAAIVLTDADHEVALRTILDGMWSTRGAACTSTARILVHESIHDEILDRVVAASERLIVGDGLDPETDIGPVLDARQKERILSQIEIATQEGARVIMQGMTPTDPRLADGYWVPPTVLADVQPGMRIAQEEICGPVACFMKFSTEDEAIEIANGTDFGVSAAVCTVDLDRALRVARRLECGLVLINSCDRAATAGARFGGVNGSGPDREHAAGTLLSFAHSKNIRIPRRQPGHVGLAPNAS
jgi:acyl-CoA reductase-like NAD-dependent aldehyde dehydrogenase